MDKSYACMNWGKMRDFYKLYIKKTLSSGVRLIDYESLICWCLLLVLVVSFKTFRHVYQK